MFERSVVERVKSCYREGEKTLLAFSGGPDSTFLFYLLLEIKKHNYIDFQFFYLNHMSRKEAFDEEEYALSLSRSFGIKLHINRFDVTSYAKDKKVSFEEAGRIIRYRFLNEIVEKEGLSSITTAHILNDNIENFFLRLFKGSGLSGLCGMRFKENNIVRPILFLEKDYIIKFLDDHSIKYFIDKSNLDDKYERNRIRNNILPIVKHYFPYFKIKLLEIQDILRETKEFIDKNTVTFNKGYNEVYIDVKKLLGLDDVIIKNSIINALKSLCKDYYISYDNLLTVLSFLKKWDFKGHKILVKTGDYSIILSYDKFFIVDKDFLIFSDEFTIEKGEAKKILNLKIKNNTGEKLFFLKPKSGQKVIINGIRKKVQDFLVDNKIHYHHRKNVFLIYKGPDFIGFLIPTLEYYSVFDSVVIEKINN